MATIYKVPQFATYPIVPLVTNMHQRVSALVAMRRLYAGSVSYDATEEEIKEMFSPFGSITCLTISWDEEKNHHKGFAFIEYDCAEAASLALHHLKGASIHGRRIKLGRPQAALRYQYIFAQIEMEGRATGQVYVTNIAPFTDPNKVVAALGQFGIIRSLRICNDKSYYVEFNSSYSAEQAVKSTNLTIESQPVYCAHLITPPGLELPLGSSFSRKSTNERSSIREKRKIKEDNDGTKKRIKTSLN